LQLESLSVDPTQQKEGDTKEGLYFGVEVPPGSAVSPHTAHRVIATLPNMRRVLVSSHHASASHAGNIHADDVLLSRSQGPMSGPNQWPDPAVMPHYRGAAEAYFDAICQLGRRLLRLLAAALQMPEDWFDDKYGTPMATLRPLRYSGRPSAPEKGAMGFCRQKWSS
jgi:isopenicillin N synthase-like dioxygenase